MTHTDNETTDSPSQILRKELEKHHRKSQSTLSLFDEKIEAMKKQRIEVEENLKKEQDQLWENYYATK